MKANLRPFFIVGIVLLMASCSKKSDKPPAAPPTDSTGTGPGGGSATKVTDVYVAGSDNGHACYWKNDTEVVLPGTPNGEASSISVNGKDVYVAGSVNYGAAYWKNGVGIGLQPKTTQGIPDTGYWSASSGCLSDSNYYVCVDQGVLSYLFAKNDFYLKIQPSGSTTEVGILDPMNSGTVNSIAVSGTNVYCAGYGIKSTGMNFNNPILVPFATYYTNGFETYLSAPPDLQPVEDYVYGQANGIAVSGTDVYVVGSQATGHNDDLVHTNPSYPVLWKNNVPQVLGVGQVSGGALAIALAGSDVYVLCYVIDYSNFYSGPAYFKNGVMTSLEAADLSVTSIGVSPGGDVYIAGNLTVVHPGMDGSTAVLWKNGSRTTLGTAANSMANAVFVYTH